MKTFHSFLLLLVFVPFFQASGAEERTVINLNGTWQFDQTMNAFPPERFTRTIPVPGLIHLAIPKIDEYDKFFKRPDKVESKDQHDLYNLDYTPRYNWYRKRVFVPKELDGQSGVLTIKKSQYVTQVYVNGMDMGSSMACYTPVEFPVTRALKFGAENDLLVKVGDRVWLPSEAAGGTDKEKEHYLPGIWDDVELSFTGSVRVDRMLVLPSVAGKKVTVKALIRSFKPAQIFYGDAMTDSVKADILLIEKKSGKKVAEKSTVFVARRDNLTEIMLEIPLADFTAWSPGQPFLYQASLQLQTGGKVSDRLVRSFGMRDFTREGKFFYLNGERIILRGTNITLQRFFEDPDCSNLVWDREWVRKLLVDIPGQLHWNAMRICVGIVPDFWYDLADEYGLMFQNEWLYWQNHGWDDQIRKEYTDWVWSDGCHPSIAIWDAINENRDDYIGNRLIPELKKLDPTRVWDAGYMTGEHMTGDEMDEPHPYQGRVNPARPYTEKNFYQLGNLDYKPPILKNIQQSKSAQLVNEYGWIWLWRNGLPSKLTTEVYRYYLGENSTPEQNRELQAYWLQLETEWLRSEPEIAGVLAFCYLANNYGYTGDWFDGDIRDLRPTPALDWFRHAFAPAAVFINLTDERYTKFTTPHEPGSRLSFNLAGINNHPLKTGGTVKIRLINEKGRTVQDKTIVVELESFRRTDIPAWITLPGKPGGYLLVAEFTPGNGEPVISRRFLKVGNPASYSWYAMQPQPQPQP